MYDPNDYTSQPSLSTTTHEADSFMQRGGVIGAIRSFIVMSVQWWIWRFLFLVALTGIISWAGIVGFTKEDVDEASTHLASGGLGPVINKLKSTEIKSTMFNKHPYFRSDWGQWFGQKYSVDPRDVYQYEKDGSQEFIIMKDVYHARKGDKYLPIVAEFSTIFGDDVEDYCDEHGASLARKNEVKKANTQRKGEGFVNEKGDGWEGKKMFRCVITNIEGAR